MVAITPDTSGNDVAFGTPNPDTFGPSPGNDQVFGGAGGDTLRGGRGNDELFGGEQQDFLFGGRGEDTLSGGPGDDELHGGRGADVLEGGFGFDLFSFEFNEGPDIIADFERRSADPALGITPDFIDVPQPSLLGMGLLTPPGVDPTDPDGDPGFVSQDPNSGVTVIDIDGGRHDQEDLVTIVGLEPGLFLSSLLNIV